MNWSSFPIDPPATLVADSSVVININATGRAADILTAIGHRVVVVDGVMQELEDGRRNGHDDAQTLQDLIRSGLVHTVSLGLVGQGIYRGLIEGSTIDTLDDGEAATIACAIERTSIALIDERKALGLCARKFPTLPIVPTAGLLLCAAVRRALGPAAQADALFAALQNARMRVPPPYLTQVVDLIGEQRALRCASLPRRSLGLTGPA